MFRWKPKLESEVRGSKDPSCKLMRHDVSESFPKSDRVCATSSVWRCHAHWTPRSTSPVGVFRLYIWSTRSPRYDLQIVASGCLIGAFTSSLACAFDLAERFPVVSHSRRPEIQPWLTSSMADAGTPCLGISQHTSDF
jgi:hypothetical protein